MANNKLNTGFFGDIAGRFGDVVSQGQQIISTTPVAKFASGARCVLKVNDQLIGFALQVSWNIQTMVTPIRTIDDYLPYELAPKMIQVSGTIGGLHIPTAGFLDDTESPMQANVVNFLHQKYISIEVRDSQTDALLFMTRKALVTSRRESFSSENLSNVTLDWIAIGYKDEQQISEIQDKDTIQNKKDMERQAKVNDLKKEINVLRDKRQALQESMGKLSDKQLSLQNDLQGNLDAQQKSQLNSITEKLAEQQKESSALTEQQKTLADKLKDLRSPGK